MCVDSKVVLISGAASGMGANHAAYLTDRGARVVIGDVDAPRGQALADKIGAAAAFVTLDVRSDSSWDEAVAFTEAKFDRLDVLINNAGVFRPGGAASTTDEDWDLITGINLTGTFKGIRAAVPALIRTGGGSIVNVSSTAGLKGFANGLAYGASKWGVRGLTKHAAIDLAQHHIRVNSVHPGNVLTPMIQGLYQDYGHVLQKRAGQPVEISALIAFLVSDNSSFSTGSEFIADGGETTGIPAVVQP